MSTCKYCGKDGLEWQVNIQKFVNPITGKQHGFKECSSFPIKLYKIVENGIPYPRKEESLAADIVNEAVRLGRDPWKVQTVRRGDELFIV